LPKYLRAKTKEEKEKILKNRENFSFFDIEEFKKLKFRFKMKIEGKILAIYKEKGKTSNQVLKELKKITKIKKIGHAGTLDPLAKGVLVVGICREATKKLAKIEKSEKEYLAKIKLGFESETDDEEGKKKKINFKKIPNKKEVKKAILKFEGEIFQTPPRYSAIKIKGEEAYKLARRGIDFKLKPRKVFIKKIELINYKFPFLKIRVISGPGVYIRSLARDIGKELKTGGYLAELERIRIGNFRKENALKIKEIKEKLKINL
jgi:tRNA pseudouridine55 synthase